MVRSIKLKDALTLYQDHFVKLGKMDSADSLTLANWT